MLVVVKRCQWPTSERKWPWRKIMNAWKSGSCRGGDTDPESPPPNQTHSFCGEWAARLQARVTRTAALGSCTRDPPHVRTRASGSACAAAELPCAGARAYCTQMTIWVDGWWLVHGWMGVAHEWMGGWMGCYVYIALACCCFLANCLAFARA